MHAEELLLCYVYIKVHGDSADNATIPSNVWLTVNVSKRVIDSTLIQCAFEYIHIILLLHISPPTLRHLKRELDLYENINHHSLYVNKFRISPFTMRTSTRAGNATFPELINHTH